MKIFNLSKHCILLLPVLMILSLISCNEISHGEQRRKFEFLYKMNNSVAFLAEYTGSLTYFKDIEFYEDRMSKISEDVKKFPTIETWDVSGKIKEKFLNVVKSNLQNTSHLKTLKLKPEDNVKKEFDIIEMNERVNNFRDELDQEIVNAGKK